MPNNVQPAKCQSELISNQKSSTTLLAYRLERTDPTAISNSFNDYFTSIADEILKKRKYNGTKSYRDFLSTRLLQNFVFEECYESEIKSVISSLSIHKTTGPNSIPTDILHLLKEEICTPLNKIFNLSLTTGEHPNILKT